MSAVFDWLHDLGRDGLLAPVAVVVAAAITGSVAWRALSQADRHHRAGLEHQNERLRIELEASRDRQLDDLSAQREAVQRQELREAVIECSTLGREIVTQLGSCSYRLQEGEVLDEAVATETNAKARPLGFAAARLELSARDESDLPLLFRRTFDQAALGAGYVAMSVDGREEVEHLLAEAAHQANNCFDAFLALARKTLLETRTVPVSVPVSPIGP